MSRVRRDLGHSLSLRFAGLPPSSSRAASFGGVRTDLWQGNNSGQQQSTLPGHPTTCPGPHPPDAAPNFTPGQSASDYADDGAWVQYCPRRLRPASPLFRVSPSRAPRGRCATQRGPPRLSPLDAAFKRGKPHGTRGARRRGWQRVPPPTLCLPVRLPAPRSRRRRLHRCPPAGHARSPAVHGRFRGLRPASPFNRRGRAPRLI